eukprot:9278036-Alexandrium_andersonii.AAC.1
MSASLVGSEMCIRDRSSPARLERVRGPPGGRGCGPLDVAFDLVVHLMGCLLYTSDAADDM